MNRDDRINLPFIGGNPNTQAIPVEQVGIGTDLSIDWGDGPRLFRVTKPIEPFIVTDDSGNETTAYTLHSSKYMTQVPAGAMMKQVTREQPPPI